MMNKQEYVRYRNVSCGIFFVLKCAEKENFFVVNCGVGFLFGKLFMWS